MTNPYENMEKAESGEVVKWTEVGQVVNGQVVDITMIPNKKTGNKEMVFTLITEDGDRVRVWERLSYKEAMKQIVVGQYVSFRFVEEKPAKEKGNNPYKVIELYKGAVGELEGEELAGDDLPEVL